MPLKLNCQSDDNLKEAIQSLRFCKDVQTPLSTCTISHLNNSLLEPEQLFKRFRMIWSQLEDIILEDKLPPNFNSVCENNTILEELQNCLHVCKDFISENCKNRLELQMKLFRNSIFRFNEMEELQLSKLNCTALRKETSGICQYFHTYLRIQWHLIILDYCLFGYTTNTRSNVILFINDLVVLSNLRYNKSKVHERESDPFLCPCVKTKWICLQLFLEGQSNMEFWDVFNEVFKEKDPIFSLWLLHHVALLQGFDYTGVFVGISCKRVVPNLDFLELKLKCLLTSELNKTEFVHSCLLNIEPLITTWWCSHVKISIFQQLWEYFYKILNVISDDAIPSTSLQILTLAENLRADPRSAKTAFQLYVGMLSKYLYKHGNQWFKLKGRIYSRLPVKKSPHLGSVALYNVYVLFICLSPVDFEELTGRICSMLENLPEDQQNSIFIWNLYCALIILYLQHERPVHTLGKAFVNVIQENVKSRDNFYLIKNFISNMKDIIQASSNYSLGQFVFLDSWMKKYLQHAHITDVEELLKLLIKIVNRVYISDAWGEWDPIFQIHIFPSLKHLAITSNASPHIGELAAVLSKVSPELCNQGMAFFTDDPVDPRVSASFAVTILQNQLVTRQENCIIKAWLRCCLLSSNNNEELTKHVLEHYALFKLFKDKFYNSNKTFYDLLEIVANETNGNNKELVLKFLLENLANLDVWVKMYIKEPRSESLTIHIYTCVAILVHRFALFLYDKTKSACLLSRIISTLLLPAETRMGRTPHNYVLHAIQRTWHLFFKGICSLNWNDDTFLERILKDLIVCYVPHFPADNNSPLLKCFDDEAIATMILHKIADAFLSQSSKSTKQHSLKVLRFFDNFINNCTCFTIMKFIASSTLIELLEFLLFNLHCHAVVTVLISLSSNDLYDAIRKDVHRSILTVTEKHVTFSSNNYFQLMQILIKVIPMDIKIILPEIRQSVIALEKIRGDGFDSTLRHGLASIEDALSV